ncbi:MAG TPA: hypothetical protein VJS44_17080 [Pyrinomonadaceae bacterium]|nr:hypothetical protein [Pyrinomonadaceae bacterium]
MRRHRLFIHALVLVAALSLGYSGAAAQQKSGGNGFDAITKHLKTRYQAKKRSIPFLGLAKFAIRIVKPAGVKSINLSLFEDLKNTGELPDQELNAMMREALSPEWQPLVSVRQRNGDQVYIYAAEAGKDVKLAVLAINQNQAVLARVKVNPDALRRFMDNPKLLGISLGGDNQPQPQALQPNQGDAEK